MSRHRSRLHTIRRLGGDPAIPWMWNWRGSTREPLGRLRAGPHVGHFCMAREQRQGHMSLSGAGFPSELLYLDGGRRVEVGSPDGMLNRSSGLLLKPSIQDSKWSISNLAYSGPLLFDSCIKKERASLKQCQKAGSTTSDAIIYSKRQTSELPRGFRPASFLCFILISFPASAVSRLNLARHDIAVAQNVLPRRPCGRGCRGCFLLQRS